MPDKSLRWLRAVLRVAVWTVAIRHSLFLLRLAWDNARTLHWFAAGQIASPWRAFLWLPIRRYASLFGKSLLPQSLDLQEATRLRRLRGLLNKVYAGYQPAADPLTSVRARNLQASVIRNVFRQMFRIRLGSVDTCVLAGYGSAGMLARDFLNYAADFGWSIPPAFTLQLFLTETDGRHAKTAGRRRILSTLKALGLHRRVGPLKCLYSIRYGAERLLSTAYWTMQDRRERKLRRSAALAAQRGGRADAMEPIRATALAEHRSLLAVFVDEMQLRAIEELLELRAHIPSNPGTAGRFKIALELLENNTRSALSDLFRKDDENARNLPEPSFHLDE